MGHIADAEKMVQTCGGDNITESCDHEAGDEEGKNPMEIEDVMLGKEVSEGLGQGSGCKYDLRKRTGARWRRRDSSKSRLKSVPESTCELHQAVSLKRSRALVIYGGGQKDEDDEFIMNMQMQEVDLLGSFFTWGNNRGDDGYVEERLDKIFVSFEWLTKFPNMKASNFYRSASDHNELDRRHKRFQFISQWVAMEGVQDAVKEGWQVQVDGSAMFQVHQKVKTTRMALLAWHKPVHRNSEKCGGGFCIMFVYWLGSCVALLSDTLDWGLSLM
ncbi:oxygen-dependent choline dehydrogenase [Striga asiatica]|uniref:Oxygen-dependent choline dehydrogenase n=1 Tax=Striga asiatica TaxID=4170 RepID=A0A5A7P188_STRAF|nr:oxygen-dependent choline dehydrogenase [Striga asiatica]